MELRQRDYLNRGRRRSELHLGTGTTCTVTGMFRPAAFRLAHSCVVITLVEDNAHARGPVP